MSRQVVVNGRLMNERVVKGLYGDVIVQEPVTQAAPTDLPSALKALRTQVETLQGAVKERAAAMGLVYVETDEMTVADGPHFAEPTPWDATNDDGQDGRPRGDEGIIRRRRMLELERKLNAMTFADREGRAGEALRKEIEELHAAEREERQRRNFGRDGLGDASPLGAQPAGQQYAEPVSPWSRQTVEGAPQVPTLAPMTDAEAERLRAEAIRLQGLIEDTQTPFTEWTKASDKLAEIEAKLRAAGRSTELGRAGGPRPQP